MISVTIYKTSSDQFRGFILSGHAGYDQYGQDIVCASVSALVINTVNSIEKFTNDTFDLEHDAKTGFMKLKFHNKEISQEGNLLMNSLVLGLKGIQSSKQSGNKKFLSIHFKEV